MSNNIKNKIISLTGKEVTIEINMFYHTGNPDKVKFNGILSLVKAEEKRQSWRNCLQHF